MKDLQAIVDQVVAQANADEQLEAVAISSSSTDVRVYEGEIESFSSADTHGVGIRVIKDGRTGFAWAGALDETIISETLADARDNASFAESDEFAGLAEPDGLAPTASDRLLRTDLVAVDTQRKIDLAVELERVIRAADPRISAVESCDYGDEIGSSAIATTTGVRGTESASASYVSAYTLASDGTDTQTGFGFSVGRHPDDLDIEAAAADAVGRATRMLGAVKPASERVTVVLDPFVTAQFLAVIASTLGGESVMKGRSLFADRVGEQVAAGIVTFVDEPTNPDAFTASALDGEGLATRRNAFIDGGVLTGFAHNAYTGRALGTASNGCAVRGGFKSRPGAGCAAVSLVPGTADQAELLSQVGDGVLVQSVSGLHSGVNPVSGDFSTGAEGLRIRGGATAEPLREFTIASTILRMLSDVSAVGGDLEWLPMSAAGVSLVIGDVTVSGA